MPIKKPKKEVVESKDIMKEKIHEGVDELKKVLNSAKTKFEESDEKTKKRIVAGIAGSIALIAGAVGLSKIKDSRKKK